MTSSNTLPESSNTLMQRLHSIKSRIVESVTEHEIPTELEKEESYIPVRVWYCYMAFETPFAPGVKYVAYFESGIYCYYAQK